MLDTVNFFFRKINFFHKLGFKIVRKITAKNIGKKCAAKICQLQNHPLKIKCDDKKNKYYDRYLRILGKRSKF